MADGDRKRRDSDRAGRSERKSDRGMRGNACLLCAIKKCGRFCVTTLFKNSLFVFDQMRQLIDHISKVLKQSSLFRVRLIDHRNTIADVGITGTAVIDVI